MVKKYNEDKMLANTMDLSYNIVNRNSILLQFINELASHMSKDVINNSLEDISATDSDTFFVYQNGEFLKQSFKDLLYIKADGSYSKLFFAENNNVRCVHVTGNIRTIEKRINNRFLIRTHRSYIVNMAYAKTITKNRIFFDCRYKEHFAKISQDGFKKISSLYPIIGCRL